MQFREREIGSMLPVKTSQQENYTHGGLTGPKIGMPQIGGEGLIIFGLHPISLLIQVVVEY
jgi:hypothetical protein